MNESSTTVKDAMKNFFRITKARMTGDENDVIIAKNYKKATNALNSSINSKQGDLDDAKERVEDAVEKLSNITHPITLIQDRDDYISAMLYAKNYLEECQEEVETISTTLKFLKEQRAQFDMTE